MPKPMESATKSGPYPGGLGPFTGRDPNVKKPQWLRQKAPQGERFSQVKESISHFKLNTVCEEAQCPNIGECWNGGHDGIATATIMVLGDTYTRGCRFCAVKTSTNPPPPPPNSNGVIFPKCQYAIPVSKKTLLCKPKLKRKTILLRIKASSKDDNAQSPKWSKWIPTGSFVADRVFRLISSATASPIGQFVSSPTTFLHSIDPRVKLLWILVLVVLPARSHIIMRFGLVAYLTLLSIWVLPRNAWMDQLGRVYFLSALLFITLGLGSDGVPALVQPRTPPLAVTGIPNLPVSLTGYSYVISKLGPLTFTRKGLSVGSTVACLTFTVFQSASLCLTTTTPEQLASALRWFMLPLRYIGVSVSEIVLTLLLSLRFISLVFDEVRNIAMGIVSRRVNWKQLTVMETIDSK